MCNLYVARMPDDTIERSTLLDATPDEVLAALDDPDLLAAWLGEWRPDTEGDGATVVTDDGVTRRVRPVESTATTRRWVWSPVADPDAVSTVTFTVTTEGHGTRLVVTETTAVTPTGTAGAASSGVRWLPALLALGAVLAVATPAVV